MNITAKTINEKKIKDIIPTDIPIYCKKVIISDFLPSSFNKDTIVISTKKMDEILPYFDFVYSQFWYAPTPKINLSDVPLFKNKNVTDKLIVTYARTFRYFAKHGFRKYFRKWAKKNIVYPELLTYILDNYVQIKKFLKD